MEEFLAQYGDIIVSSGAFIVGVLIKGSAREMILKVLKYATLVFPIVEAIKKKSEEPQE